MFSRRLLPILLSTTVGYSMLNPRINAAEPKSKTLFDFTKIDNVDDWIEQSDTVRTVGMSKAALVLQKTQVFQRAIFFALLNPQPNGAGFAGMRKIGRLDDLSDYSALQIRCRSQGEYNDFKVVLRHKNLNDEPNVSYEQIFKGPRDDFESVTLPFEDFKPYYRGQLINDSEPLDTSNITGFGLQFHGGVYLPTKQKGPATLEIDNVKAVE